MREFCRIEVCEDDLGQLAPGELAEWDQVWAADLGPIEVGDWLVAHGIPFRVIMWEESLGAGCSWYGGPA